jgi:hypothetical protein
MKPLERPLLPRGELGVADVHHNADVAELTPPLALLRR